MVMVTIEARSSGGGDGLGVVAVVAGDNGREQFVGMGYDMPPKRKATAHEKGKGHVSGSSSRTRHVVEPPNDGDIPRFRTDEMEECYTKTWASKVCHKERQVAREDFFHHLLERVIQHCGWHKVADAPHAAYPTLVREFFANFNPDIDVPESSHRYKTWVRGQWIRFSPTMIDRYYDLTRTEVVPLPAPHELDLVLVARFLYGRDDAWPLATPRFMHDQLTRELRVLHIFGVSLFPTEEADPPAALLNARSVENSETKIAAQGGRVHAAPAMNAGEDYLDDDDPAPPPAPAAGLDLSVQMAQLMATQTEMGHVSDLQRADAMTRSNLCTSDFQYHQLHDQISRIGSHMETLDENVARISGTLSGLSQTHASFPTSTSAGPPPYPDPSASHLHPGST
ncbi:hypothetical protein Adt_23410 [Abeliophyllum distichum]|uniref:Putative plant transposon protein domain-containing protein n=1 Tax=Abeliophyllum distichum TaxID=126358 RepID=A0ABD1SAS3_9LAMI